MNFKLPLALGAALVLSIAGCSKSDDDKIAEASPEKPSETPMTSNTADSNPFFNESPLYLHYPQFDKVENAHFIPAFERGMEEQLAEVEAIAGQTSVPTLDNTLIPLERSGQMLDRVGRVFFSLASAHTNDGIEEIRSEMAPRLSAHRDRILLDGRLFERIQALYEQRDELELDPESFRLVEETYKDFVRAGGGMTVIFLVVMLTMVNLIF